MLKYNTVYYQKEIYSCVPSQTFMFVEFGDPRGDVMIDTPMKNDPATPGVSVCNECCVQPLINFCRALIVNKITWIMAWV